ADVDVIEADSIAREIFDIRGEAREGAAIRSDAENLRADVRGDSAPDDRAGILVGEGKAAGLGPVDAKFVVMMAGGNVRVAAGEHVGIDADGDGGALAASGDVARSFVDEDFELGGGLDIEEEDAGSARAGACDGGCAGVAEGGTNFFARFADAGKNDAIAGDANAAETIELAAGDNVEA